MKKEPLPLKQAYKIPQIVADYFEIPVKEIFTKSRKREIVQVRQISQSIINELYGNRLSLDNTGLIAGGQNHSMVCHAIKTVRNLCDVEIGYRDKYDDIMARVLLTIYPGKPLDQKPTPLMGKLRDLLKHDNLEMMRMGIRMLIYEMQNDLPAGPN